MRVIIIGAGIGGLCTAIALQQSGIEFTLYERAASLRASGAGISLWPNATRILQRFELLNQLMAQGEPIYRTQIQSEQGTILTGLDLTAFDQPTVCIQRALLQRTLAEAIPADSIRVDHALSAIIQDEDGVTVQFENGAEASADLLVAADGIYSTARSLLWKAPAPEYQGYMAWRGILKQSLSDWEKGLALQCWGRGKRFGLLSMGPNQMYWFASLNSQSPTAEVLSKQDYLRESFRDWNPRVREAIALTNESDIIVRPIETAPRLKSWHQGRVLLLGDAAHAMTPNLGQGACMAIEDAAVLGQSLHKTRSVSQALLRYERQRKARVNQVTLRSYLLGQIGQMESLTLTSLRSVGLKLAPEIVLRLSFQTLFRDRTST